MHLIVGAAVLSAFLLSDSTAMASLVLSADEICSPTDDPCVVDRPYDVTYAFPLDFGLRKVVVTGAGLFRGGLDLSCGSFQANPVGRWMEISGLAVPDVEAVVHARRGCSLGPDTPCIHDEECALSELGTCSIGDGSIDLGGAAVGVGTAVVLRAAGDVRVRGQVNMSGFPAAYPNFEGGGAFIVESSHGSIDVQAGIYVDAGPMPSGRPGFAGIIDLRAFHDLRVERRLSAIGGYGEIRLEAGGDVRVSAPIIGHGVVGKFAGGAELAIAAGRDLSIARPPKVTRLPINLHGGSNFDDGVNAAAGGNGTLIAGRDILVSAGVAINANSGRSSGNGEDIAYGGEWVLNAGDDIVFHGRLRAQGRGPLGHSEDLSVKADGDILIGPSASITLYSQYVDDLHIESRSAGNITIDGHLNVRGRHFSGRYGPNSGGGSIDILGGDLTVGGVIETGGGSTSGDLYFDVCRLHLLAGGRIDASLDAQEAWVGNLTFNIRESMRTEDTSVISGKPESAFRIFYRDVAKPPTLLGLALPTPELSVSAGIVGCPVCGNGEVDEGEDCDDGNLVGFDGCDEGCQSARESLAPAPGKTASF